MTDATTEPWGVLFDVDGVLIDSYEAHYASWLTALNAHGLEMDRPLFVQTFGRTNKDIFAHYYPSVPADLVVASRRSSSGNYDANREFWNRYLTTPMICHTPSNPRSETLPANGRWRWFPVGEAGENTSEIINVVTAADPIFTGGPNPLPGNPVNTAGGTVQGWLRTWAVAGGDIDISNGDTAPNGTVIGTLTNTDSTVRVFIARWAAGAQVQGEGYAFAGERVFFPMSDTIHDTPSRFTDDTSDDLMLMYKNAYNNLLEIPFSISTMQVRNANLAAGARPGYTNQQGVLLHIGYNGAVNPETIQVDVTEYYDATSQTTTLPYNLAGIPYTLLSTTDGVTTLTAVLRDGADTTALYARLRRHRATRGVLS